MKYYILHLYVYTHLYIYILLSVFHVFRRCTFYLLSSFVRFRSLLTWRAEI